MYSLSRNNILIEKLKRDKYLRSEYIIKIMRCVDRGDFVSNENCYEDSPQYIGYGATISAPHMHAIALELLGEHLKRAKKCLDVGSGSGYLTLAFLLAMIDHQPDSKVASYGIEHVPDLVIASQNNITKHFP